MNNLKTLANPFQFNNSDVRTAVGEDDQVWFCAQDICEILEINYFDSKIESMPNEWKAVLQIDSDEDDKYIIFINELGMYKVIFQYETPKSIDFSNWIFFKVLPKMRDVNIK